MPSAPPPQSEERGPDINREDDNFPAVDNVEMRRSHVPLLNHSLPTQFISTPTKVKSIRDLFSDDSDSDSE